MADDKQGRDKQATDQDRRQRQRALQEALERADEPEPIEAALDELELVLETHEYPATPDELREEFGNQTLDTPMGQLTIGDVFREGSEHRYDSASEVRTRIRESVINGE